MASGLGTTHTNQALHPGRKVTWEDHDAWTQIPGHRTRVAGPQHRPCSRPVRAADDGARTLMARGIGGKYGLDQGTNPARGLFSNPMTAAPASPRAGVGTVATVQGTGGVSAAVGDTPAQAAQLLPPPPTERCRQAR